MLIILHIKKFDIKLYKGKPISLTSKLPCHQMCEVPPGSSPPPTNSLMPAGCATIQFNPDTIYLEMASDPTG